HERVVRRFERPVQRDREFHDTEIRAEVSPGPRDVLDEESPDLVSEFVQLRRAEPIEIARSVDAGKNGHQHLLNILSDVSPWRGRGVSIVPPRPGETPE